MCRDAVLARAECLERDQRGGGREQLLITEDMTRPERIQVTPRHAALRHTASRCVTMRHNALRDKCSCTVGRAEEAHGQDHGEAALRPLLPEDHQALH